MKRILKILFITLLSPIIIFWLVTWFIIDILSDNDITESLIKNWISNF